MSGFNVNSKLHNSAGGIETLIFSDLYNYILQDDEDPTKIIQYSRSNFEKLIDKQKYIPKLVASPNVILNEYQKQDRDIRLKYLTVLRDLVHEKNLRPTVLSTYHTLIETVEKKHPETQAAHHPAHKTICSHWRTWVNANFDKNALASKCRNGSARINPASEAELKHHISTLWSDSESKLRSAHYSVYKRNVEEKAKSTPSIQVVSKRTFYRRMNSLSKTSDKLNSPHISQAERNRLLLTLKGRIKTHYAMQRVELDRMTVNMCLLDDDTNKPTPPISIYTAIDCYTGVPVAAVVDYGKGENKENVLNLLRQIYITDENLKASGKPTVLVMDNGPGFNCASTQKACERLNVTVVYTPSNQPSKKPYVESFNKTLREQFFRGMHITDSKDKSTVGFNSYKGKRTDKNNTTLDKGLEKYADITVSDFLCILNKFLTEYVHQVHKRRGVAPIMSWNESIKRVPRPHFTYDQVKEKFHVFKAQDGNKLQPNGTVRCLKQDFYSSELKQFYIEMNGYKNNAKNPIVHVHFDPFDARYVSVSFKRPNCTETFEIVATNCDIESISEPTSFDELNGYQPKSFSVYQKEKIEITGQFGCEIPSFGHRKSRKNRSGQPVSSFNTNVASELSTSERISLSNNAESKLTKDIDANIESTSADMYNMPAIKRKTNKKHTPKGKKREW